MGRPPRKHLALSMSFNYVRRRKMSILQTIFLAVKSVRLVKKQLWLFALKNPIVGVPAPIANITRGSQIGSEMCFAASECAKKTRIEIFVVSVRRTLFVRRTNFRWSVSVSPSSSFASWSVLCTSFWEVCPVFAQLKMNPPNKRCRQRKRRKMAPHFVNFTTHFGPTFQFMEVKRDDNKIGKIGDQNL